MVTHNTRVTQHTQDIFCALGAHIVTLLSSSLPAYKHAFYLPAYPSACLNTRFFYIKNSKFLPFLLFKKM